MSVEHTIYCDECGDIVVADSSTTKARAAAKREGMSRIQGRDICRDCKEKLDRNRLRK